MQRHRPRVASCWPHAPLPASALGRLRGAVLVAREGPADSPFEAGSTGASTPEMRPSGVAALQLPRRRSRQPKRGSAVVEATWGVAPVSTGVAHPQWSSGLARRGLRPEDPAGLVHPQFQLFLTGSSTLAISLVDRALQLRRLLAVGSVLPLCGSPTTVVAGKTAAGAESCSALWWAITSAEVGPRYGALTAMRTEAMTEHHSRVESSVARSVTILEPTHGERTRAVRDVWH